MPLTEFQRALLAELAADCFHDSEARVASAFAADRDRLQRAGYTVDVELSQPGFIRAVVHRAGGRTRVDWAHDSAWRFMPLVRDPLGGLLLHPVDLAINKILALAGRDEPRDFVDTLFVHRRVLPLAGMCWAAAGKDPGLSPLSLLELLKRRGRYRPEDFTRLHLVEPFDLATEKTHWLAALTDAEVFARRRSPDEAGCLYYESRLDRFVLPRDDADLDQQGIVLHRGAPGGVVPRISDSRIELQP